MSSVDGPLGTLVIRILCEVERFTIISVDRTIKILGIPEKDAFMSTINEDEIQKRDLRIRKKTVIVHLEGAYFCAYSLERPHYLWCRL